MNILVLNGSPRINGNTSALVNAFMEGARESNHNVSYVLYKASGEIICKGDFVTPEFLLDMSSLANGVYILKISIGKDANSWKIIKK